MTTTLDSQTPAAENPPTTPAERVPEADAASLDKVRDLIFGVQMRDYDRRFARLEERLSKDTADLREDVKKRLAAIEALIHAEIESLSERLLGEQEARSTAAKNLSRELADQATTFERKTNQLDDQIARGTRELRQQLHEQQQRLSDDLRQQAEDIMAKLARAAQELRTEKADRATLAALLTEMAMRLNDEFRIPVHEERRA